MTLRTSWSPERANPLYGSIQRSAFQTASPGEKTESHGTSRAMQNKAKDQIRKMSAGSARISSMRSGNGAPIRDLNSWKATVASDAERTNRLAQLEFLNGRMGNTLSLFLLLWDHRGCVVSHEEISRQFLSCRSPHLRHQGVAVAVSLVRSMQRKNDWPFRIENVFGEGYRLRLSDVDWNWEKLALLAEPEIDAATTFMSRAPNTPRLVGLIMGILWCRRNRIVTTSEIAERWKHLIGKRATANGISHKVYCARNLIVQQNWSFSIQAISGLGFMMTDNPSAEDPVGRIPLERQDA